MRPIILGMMTTMNDRLDDPMAWVHGVAEDQYADIDAAYAGYDAILVGRATYEEMAAYWPTALEGGTETNRRMAGRMRDLRKIVVSRSEDAPLSPWQHVERLVAPSDEALAERLLVLREEPGGDILLAGGASLARAVVALGVVDEYRLHVYPAVSPGATWFGPDAQPRGLRLLSSRAFSNGVLGLRHGRSDAAPPPPTDNFTERLT